MAIAVQNTAELRRVLALPRHAPTLADCEALSDQLSPLLRQPGSKARLRPLQALALYYVATYGSAFIPLDVGAGKTLVSLLASAVSDAAWAMLLLPANLIGKTQLERDRYAIDWRIPNTTSMVSYQSLGRKNYADLLETQCPPMLIADECFPGYTQVWTPTGPRRIDRLKAGDLVLSFESDVTVQTVKGVGLSETQEYVEVRTSLGPFTSTLGHPVLTLRGWVLAGELKTNDEIVRVVQDDSAQDGEGQVLRSELFRKVADDTARGPSESVSSGSRHQDCRVKTGQAPAGLKQAYDREQPHGQSGSSSKDDSINAGSTTISPRGKRISSVESACTPCVPATGLGDGSTYPLGPRKRSPLSNRLGSDRVEGGDRSGRDVSQYCGSKGLGQSEGCSSYRSGLARVESVQRRSADLGRGEGIVYNLSVTGPETYLVEDGYVVHNCHYLKSLDSAVTRRVARYMAKHPTTQFLPMTGTPMRDSLRNFAHLMAWSLKENTPLPMGPELHDWANALDERPDGQEDWEERPDLGALKAFGEDLSGARQGLRAHIIATPGVVALATDQPTEDVPYRVHIRGLLYDVAPVTHEHVSRLRKEGLTPDDWPITPADAWRHTRELVTGFHYIQVDANGNRPPEEWRQPRSKWFAYVRSVLSRSRRFDSPEQVQDAVIAGGRDGLAEGRPVLEAWEAVKESFRPVPVPVWHDDSALDYVARWMAVAPGLVWVEHVAFAEALAKRTGSVYYRERGLDRDGNPVEQAPVTRSVILSVKANKEGRNLQAWNRNLVVSPREGADEWHQLIGRTARPGQTRDVTVDVMVGCAEHQLAWDRANAAAQAILDTTGNGSRLLGAQVQWPPTYAMTGPLWAGR